MNYIKNLLKRYSLSNLKTLILITNVIYIASILLKIYISNPLHFFENAFQAVNLVFYLYVALSYLLIKNVKLFFLSSVLLILDLPVNLKPPLQNFLAHYFNVANILGNPLMMNLAF